MARIDHTNCPHPRTPAGRAACRAGRVMPVVAPATVDDIMNLLDNPPLVADLIDATSAGVDVAPVAPATRPIPVIVSTRPLYDCRHCGFAHECTEEWCGSMGAEIDRNRGKAEQKNRRSGGGNVISPDTAAPATGLAARHTDPITLRVADGKPALPPVAGPPATEPQLAFITTLLADRDVPGPVDATTRALLVSGNLTKYDASAVITTLKQYPTKPETVDLPDVPAGSYAIDGSDDAINTTMFVRVWHGRGRVRVYQKLSDTSNPLPRSATRGILERIAAAGVMECAERYGRELGECGVCHRELTNDVSRARGIGPKCLAKRGW